MIDTLNLNDLSIREVEGVVGKPADALRQENRRVVLVFAGVGESGVGADTHVHIRKV